MQANHHRYVGRRNVELIEDGLCGAVVIKIYKGIWMPVPGKELFDAKRLRTVVGAQQKHVADPLLDQLTPALNECPYKDVTQLGISLYQSEKATPVKFNHLGVIMSPDLNQSTPA